MVEKERTRCLGILEDEEGGQRREERVMMETSRRGRGRIEQKLEGEVKPEEGIESDNTRKKRACSHEEPCLVICQAWNRATPAPQHQVADAHVPYLRQIRSDRSDDEIFSPRGSQSRREEGDPRALDPL